jgi:type VI secretion system protein ImpA
MVAIDLERLVAPIAGENPCGQSKDLGEDLQLINLYSKVQTAFDSARKIEKARADLELLPKTTREQLANDLADRPNDPKRDPNWASIAQQCTDILSNHAKDCRVLAWLIESNLRADGFEGYTSALRLATALVSQYGMDMHPKDESDPGYGLSFLERLSQSSSMEDALGRVCVNPQSDRRVFYAGKVVANYLENQPESVKSEFEELGSLTQSSIENQIANADLADLKSFQAQLATAQEATNELDKTLLEKSKDHQLSVAGLRNQLKDISDWFMSLAGARLTAEADAPVAPAEGSAKASGGSVESNALRNREEAFNSLLKVASFFRKTEPHSPVSYALEQAVRWGKMPLPELLRELVQDDSARREMFQRLGIKEIDKQ